MFKKVRIISFVSILQILHISCANIPIEELYLGPKRQKSVVVIDDPIICEYRTSIKTRPIWSAPQKDGYLDGIWSLKKKAYRKDGNAISQIRMTDNDRPYSEANVYQCPQEVFDKYKPLQDDKEFLYSNIKFDLPKPKTDEEEKK